MSVQLNNRNGKEGAQMKSGMEKSSRKEPRSHFYTPTSTTPRGPKSRRVTLTHCVILILQLVPVLKSPIFLWRSNFQRWSSPDKLHFQLSHSLLHAHLCRHILTIHTRNAACPEMSNPGNYSMIIKRLDVVAMSVHTSEPTYF